VTRQAPSLLLRLALRIAVVLALALALLLGFLVHRTLDFLGNLDDASLQAQADQIAEALIAVSQGTLALELPRGIREAYEGSRGGLLYLVRAPDGRVLFSSGATATALLAAVERRPAGRSFFRLPIGDAGPYAGLALRLEAPQPVDILVAQGRMHADVVTDTLIGDFAEELGWGIVAVFLSLLAVVLWTLRRGLSAVGRVSAEAARIGPANTDVRLSVEGVPRELRPLVDAVNAALDRLEAGFAVQRRFTADAAHELRTPLAILTARVDELADGVAAREMATDVRRMNRLIDQLLRAARLDAMPLRLEPALDLREVAGSAVGYLAPMAIAARRSLALESPADAVRVRGNRAALEDALRNLIENAIAFAPEESEVLVGVSGSATDAVLSVRDSGPGVPAEHREAVFRRFWRGPERDRTGSGLGLAIVAETARAHGGGVEVDGAPGGGAVFRLRLPRLPENAEAAPA